MINTSKLDESARNSNIENLAKELVHLHDIKDVRGSWLDCKQLSLYVGVLLLLSVRILAVFTFITIVTEYIITYFEILKPGFNAEDMQRALKYSFCMALFFTGCCVQPLYFHIKRSLRDIHPKWEIYNSVILLCVGSFGSISTLFVCFNLVIDFPELAQKAIPAEHMNFVIKYLKHKMYIYFLIVTFIALALGVLLANKKANQLYVKKYSKLKFYLSKLKKAQKPGSGEGG